MPVSWRWGENPCTTGPTDHSEQWHNTEHRDGNHLPSAFAQTSASRNGQGLEEIGKRGGILVDNYLRTSDEHIYAIGDAIEVKDFITNTQTIIPLAGPANRQGRIVADTIAGRPTPYKRIDILATAIKASLTVFDLADLELAYAPPPYSSAKDPVNMLRYVASNIIFCGQPLARGKSFL